MEGLGLNPDFWQGRRALVTGHTGFKGSWLSLWLQDLGAQLTGYALEAPTQPNLYGEAQVAGGMHAVTGDVRDIAHLRQVLADSGAEVVFHLAAQPLVRASYAAPVDTFAVNVMGTAHVLEAVRDCPQVKAVVIVTTDKCYQNREWVWPYREDEALGGHDPYSASKACAELVVGAYRDSFLAGRGVAVATARAGNVIGGGDWAADRLVPDLLRAFESGAPAVLRHPDAVRPWQHVLEPLRAYLELAERLYRGQSVARAWNFGPYPQDIVRVEALARQLAGYWGPHAQVAVAPAEGPPEAQLLALDISLARRELGWEPLLRLPDALKLVVEWTQARRSGAPVRDITLRQIRSYQAAIAAAAASNPAR